MFLMGIEECHSGRPKSEAMQEVFEDVRTLRNALKARQAQLLKQPWGGKVRAAKEAANGWTVDSPKWVGAGNVR